MRAVAVSKDRPPTAEDLAGAGGVFVAGGLTPGYQEALVGAGTDWFPRDVVYGGFSAGAAIAADTALIGGWKLEGVPVIDEDFSENLEDITVTVGLGLVDLAVEVHAAQWGTLTRLIAATEAGLVEGGVAIDEFTVLIVGDDEFAVVGQGSVWQVTAHEDGVLVSSLNA